MPNLKLTNLASYRQYFTDIAAKHLQINDFKWGDKDILLNANRSELKWPFLWVIPYDKARYGDGMSDNVVKKKVANLSFFTKPNSAKFSDEDAAFDFCEGVVEDIVSKIFADKKGHLNSAGDWEMIATTIGSITTGPVEVTLGSSKYVGWDLSIEFMDNANLAYDPGKWHP